MMRIKAFFTLLLLSLASAVSQAQIVDPVKWSITFDKTGEDTGEIVAKATIEAKWHVYALTVSSDPNAIGPIPTSMMITPSEFFEPVGKPTEGKFITHYDPNFEMDLNYFENTATFKQKIKIKKPGSFDIKGKLEYMACDDQRCIFPDPVDFKINVAKDGEANSEATPAKNTSNSGILRPVKWSIATAKVNDSEYDVLMTATIDQGWHLYSQNLESNEGPVPTSFKFTTADNYELVGTTYEGTPTKVFDKNFQVNVAYYSNKAEFKQRVKVLNKSSEKLVVAIEFMCCDDEKCLPPTIENFKIDVIAGTYEAFDPTSSLPSAGTNNNDPLDWTKVSPSSPYSTCEQQKEEETIWWAFLQGLFWGLFALLTPCVFPMIPLTVSFFTKSSESSGGKSKAILYGLFIFLVYVSVSIPFHIFSSTNPEVFNQFATNPWVNLVFFIIFIVFAISFFGYYEITLPSGFANKIDNKSNIGGILGVFFMALTLVIVSFSCTGPILGGMLGQIYATSSQGTVGFLGMDLALAPTKLTAATAGFGLALGGPFGLFAFFPSLMKKLPKSGGWLEDTKVSLGFLELALALKFLSQSDLVLQLGLIKRELFFAIWIIIGLFWALYLFGIFKFKKGQGSKKLSTTKLVIGISIALFTLRLVPGVLPPSNLNKFEFLSGFPPPKEYSYYHHDSEFIIYKDLAEAIQVAKEQNKPLFVDFTGWACVNCRKMEENVWPQDSVRKILAEQYIMVSLYVDEKVELPSDQQFVYTTKDGRIKEIKTVGNKWSTLQTETFENNSQPFYVILAPDSTLLSPPEQYNSDVSAYTRWLRCGVQSYEQWSESDLAKN